MKSKANGAPKPCPIHPLRSPYSPPEAEKKAPKGCTCLKNYLALQGALRRSDETFKTPPPKVEPDKKKYNRREKHKKDWSIE